jgi:hypothetical protein
LRLKYFRQIVPPLTDCCPDINLGGRLQRTSFLGQVKIDGLVKSLFVNNFEHFGKKALMMFSVKNANCLRALDRVLAF